MRLLTLATAFVLPTLVIAGGEHMHDVVSQNDPPIKITINPETRVSVMLAGSLPPPVACGAPADLTVKILNQGFVTSRLEAEFVEDAPAGAVLEFYPEPLKGVAQETRNLRITLIRPGLTDITLAFRSHNNVPDLGGRDRIHFLMSCTQS